MASIIKLKRSSTASAVPASLQVGEIAVNLFDRKLYVGNTTGVTAIGGEDFRLTTVSSVGSEGAYLKLIGDSVLSTNTVFLSAGEGIDIARAGNGSITFAAELATDSNKGVASFDNGDFVVTSGVVTLANTVNGAVLALNGTAGETTVSRTNGIVTIGLPDDVSITSQLNVGENAVVSGNTSVGGALRVTGASALNGVTATTIQANGSIATSSGLTVAGTSALNGVTATTIQANGSIATSSGLTVAGTSALNGVTATTISSNGEATFASATVSDLTSGRVVLAGAAGSLTDSLNLTFNGSTLNVGGGADLTGTLNVDGSSTLNALTVTTFTANSDATVVGQLNVGENVVVAGNTAVGGNLTVDGNLTVEGALTYLSTSTVYTDDGMMKLAANNAGDTIDTGIYAAIYNAGNTSYTYSGYFRDATTKNFVFYKDLDVEPTATVNTNDSGYALAQVDAVIDGGSY